MALNETDYELLDSYLDDALSAEESQRLRARLADESELADAMHQLSFERDMRARLFNGLEPDERTVNRFCDHVFTSARRADQWRKRARVLRFASSAAALLMVGFFSGFVLRGGARGTFSSPPAIVFPAANSTLVTPPTAVHNEQ